MSSSSDPSLATEAPHAAVTAERKLNIDLQEQLPKPCTCTNLPLFTPVLFRSNVSLPVSNSVFDLLSLVFFEPFFLGSVSEGVRVREVGALAQLPASPVAACLLGTGPDEKRTWGRGEITVSPIVPTQQYFEGRKNIRDQSSIPSGYCYCIFKHEL